MVIFHTTKRFKRSFKKLPQNIRADFSQKIEIFEKNPDDATLRIHKLHGNLGDSHSFSLKKGFRVLLDFLGKNEVLLVDVGDHDKYKKWEKN